jgi:hypothetical protein
MGTVPLVKSFLDTRNIATLLSYAVLLLLTYVAVVTENRQQATVIIMVSTKLVCQANNLWVYPSFFLVFQSKKDPKNPSN